MFKKQVPHLIEFVVAFVAVLGGLWTFLELIGYFFADSWGPTVATWNDGAGFWVLLVVSSLVALVSVRYASFLGFRSEKSIDAADYSFDSPNHFRNRENVIANVTSSYIDGVLQQTLHESVRIELGLKSMPETLRRPQILWEGQRSEPSVSASSSIYNVFLDSGRALLILGEPGSGKTMTLLELCDSLLIAAVDDANEPVPAVLNLSSWAKKQENLASWIADEMHRQYQLSVRVTSHWLANGHLCLLLDGLDEVVEETNVPPFLGNEVTVIHTLAYPQIIRKDTQVIHSMVTKPALQLLSDPKFKTANQEYLEALDDYRKGDYGDCLTKSCSAFESVMKIVCDKNGWAYKQTDTAGKLIKIIVDNTDLDSYFEQPLIVIATLRNKHSKSHGAGTQPKKVSQNLAQYALNSTAAAIVLVANEAK